MASESRTTTTTVVEHQNGTKEVGNENDDSEDGIPVIQNFRKVYKENWRQMSAVSAGTYSMKISFLQQN